MRNTIKEGTAIRKENGGNRGIIPPVEFRNVSISFNDLQVLRDVSFTLEPNEMLFVTGASASGKTVLLHLAMGILRPDSGEIFIEGQEITKLKEEELLTIRGEKLGLVFQDEALFTGMDVYDNAAYRLEEHGWPPDKVDSAVEEVLGFVGLDEEMSTEVFELSGGMKRRLELARAIIGWPPIMLFDEPTTGLDPINARQVRNLIIGAREFHSMSAIYVSKAMHEIDYLVSHYARREANGKITVVPADEHHRPQTRVMVLDAGRIVFLGSHEEFRESSLPAILSLRNPHPSSAASNYQTNDPWKDDGKEHDVF